MTLYKMHIITLLSFCLIANNAVGYCLHGHREWLGRCVLVVDRYDDIGGAQSYCHSGGVYGGTLLELDDVANELPHLKELIGGSYSGAWLGGKAGKLWYWTDDNGLPDKMILEKYWAAGEPNQNENSLEDRISLLNSLGFEWNDERRETSHYTGSDTSYYKAICSVSEGTVLYHSDYETLFTVNQKKYFIPYQDKLNWLQAVQLCATKYQANLIRIESQSLQTRLEQRLSPSNNYWISGLWDGKYSLTWRTSGKPIPSHSWIWSKDPTTEPALDSQCVFAHHTSYGFRLSYDKCTVKMSKYICAYSHQNGVWKMETTTSTIPTKIIPTTIATAPKPTPAKTTSTLATPITTIQTTVSKAPTTETIATPTPTTIMTTITKTTPTTTFALTTTKKQTPTKTAKPTTIITTTPNAAKAITKMTTALVTQTITKVAATTTSTKTASAALFTASTIETPASAASTTESTTTASVASTTYAPTHVAATISSAARPTTVSVPTQTLKLFTSTTTIKSSRTVKDHSIMSPSPAVLSSSVFPGTYHRYDDSTTATNFILTSTGQILVIVIGGFLCLLFLLIFLLLLYRRLRNKKKTKVNPENNELVPEDTSTGIKLPEEVKKDCGNDFWP